MVATVEISETNTGSVTTNSITNLNFGNVDAINIVIATNPINRGDFSFEKFIRYRLAALGGSNKIDNFKVWLTGSEDTGIVHDSNLTGSMLDEAYHTPISTASAEAIRVVPRTTPTNQNVGKSGAGAAGLTVAGSFSDNIIMQAETQGGAAPGDQTSNNWFFQYDEQ